MTTGMKNNHFPTYQSAQPPHGPSATDLALIAAQWVRPGGRKVKEGENPYADAAKAAYGLWSACNAHLQSKNKPNGGATEQVREHRRRQLKALGLSEPAEYPVDLTEFLKLTACPGRSHPDRLAKFRTWLRSLGESDDVSTIKTPEDFLAFSMMAVQFGSWLKEQRSESAKRARTSKNIKKEH